MADIDKYPQPHRQYTSSPLRNDIAAFLNRSRNPLSSLTNKIQNDASGLLNYFYTGAEPFGTTRPEGDFQGGYFNNTTGQNLTNSIKGGLNPNFNPKTGIRYPVISMPIPGQTPPTPNMGNSVGTPAEQAEFIKEYNRMAIPAPTAITPEEDLKNRPAYSGLLFGQQQADVQKEEGLMGGLASKIFNNPILQRLMQGSLYSRPNFQEGFGGVVQRAAEGEVALRRGEDAQALAQAKVDAAKAKAGDGIPTKDKNMIEQINKFAKAKGGVDLIKKMINQVPGSIGGPGVVAEDLFVNFTKIFNFNPDMTNSQKVNAIRLKLIDQFEFIGKDMSTADRELINRMLPEAGKLTMSAKEFVYSLNLLKERFENKATISGNILRKDYGRDPLGYIQTAPAPQTRKVISRS